MSTKKKATVSSKQIAGSVALLKQVVAPFAEVTPLTATDRKRLAKLKRGAHQVIPTIANLARKFAIEAPGMTVNDMLSNIQHAGNLEPLLTAVAAFHQTLKDEYLAASGGAWKTATVTYGMLQSAGNGNRRVADELEQVKQWFRPRVRPVVVDTNGQPVPPKRKSEAKTRKGKAKAAAAAHAAEVTPSTTGTQHVSEVAAPTEAVSPAAGATASPSPHA